MLTDPVFTAFVVAVLASLPAIILALTARKKAVVSEQKAEDARRAVNGHQEALIRRLVQDAWEEGHRAGLREHSALMQPPPNPETHLR